MTVAALPQAHGAAYFRRYSSGRGSATQPMANTAQTYSAQSTADQVSLSGQGRLLSRLPPLFSEEIAADGVITGEELSQFFPAKSAEFGQEVSSRLQGLGVDTGQAIALASDAQGQVRVVGDHPDKAKIEAMFSDDPELANRFRQLSGLASLLSASQKHLEFAQEYARNPEAAVANHPELFSSLPSLTVLTLAGGSLTAQTS